MQNEDRVQSTSPFQSPDAEIREVPLEAFPGIRIGQAEDAAGGTGITVVLSEDPAGMAAGLHIGGGGPATRETGILDPVTTAQRVHAAVLGGGSAFGLDAAGGVMRYLEEKGIGVEVRGVRVPLVTQVDLFDLPVGDPHVRPDQAMGYAACKAAEQGVRGNYKSGCRGAGCGATIGKYAGIEHAMKSGIGACVLRHGDLLVGAVIAVNAFGDIYDWKSGQKIAGAHTPDGRLYDRMEMVSFMRALEGARVQNGRMKQAEDGAFNTTIGIVFTNAPFRKAELCKIAAMAHDGFARSIAPVHTSGDGDSVIALSVCSRPAPEEGAVSLESDSLAPAGADGSSGTLSTAEKALPAAEKTCVQAGIDSVGILAAMAASEAILRGVRSAESAYGLTALADLR